MHILKAKTMFLTVSYQSGHNVCRLFGNKFSLTINEHEYVLFINCSKIAKPRGKTNFNLDMMYLERHFRDLSLVEIQDELAIKNLALQINKDIDITFAIQGTKLYSKTMKLRWQENKTVKLEL